MHTHTLMCVLTCSLYYTPPRVYAETIRSSRPLEARLSHAAAVAAANWDRPQAETAGAST